jgi:flagellar motor switch protein FliN/FliY
MTDDPSLTLPDLDSTSHPQKQPAIIEEQDLDPVLDVPIKLTAILGRTKLPIAEVLRLAEGSVLELEKAIGEPVDLLVNDRLVARGEVVLVDQQLGVTLSEIL